MGDDPWTVTHGAEPEASELGAGILYYSLAYALRATVCVCLGSGGGFVPRLMRQAQRDLDLIGARTILIDGGDHVPHDVSRIWGSPMWQPEHSRFRQHYPDVEIIVALTETAYNEHFAAAEVTIDYLHIDADHNYEGARRDWDLYHPLVADGGVITVHDTENHRPPCGVPQLLDEIRHEGRYSVMNFPIRYGTAILKRNPETE